MTIPWLSLFGGMLLGVSATLLLLLNGKIAGISGVLTGLMTPKKKDYAWRWLFVLGMISGGAAGVYFFGAHVPTEYTTNTPLLIIAGLLVGIGTRLGNGCTSGHGICGIGRLSVRSIVATCVFMLVAGLTVFVRLHIL
ncbi:YeeE/YedE family protein [Aliivibrio fischeri]|uniref:YeeE/YedE family protein n=1 Tax=Aliivibrio fischeri TaxID=668 RepID=UPI0007C5099A|nr:YeeE/YedE family protein [Aliivibrio fischeri]TDM55117.1 YeeE/YedE family protein [Aliivibrio fischeri]